ncbi:RICIN domain-containing protein [Streptomyces vinaceus]|uniref:RICIN domain-containing protein n=1 Tax=Streptomyces vinaceus TaxID=1960 RepID=UPI00381830C6
MTSFLVAVRIFEQEVTPGDKRDRVGGGRGGSAAVAGASGSTSDGTAVQQRTCGTASDQKWKIAAVGGGFTLTAQHSGKCLDVSGSSIDDGARIIKSSCGGRVASSSTRACVMS